MITNKAYGSKDLEKDFGPLTFGRALWAHRKCEKMSQKDFAKILGFSAQSLCDIEKGRRIPSPKRAVKIAKKIGMPEKSWLKLVFQDMLRQEHLEYTVSVA